MKVCGYKECPRSANKRYKGYCSKVHYKLATKKPKKRAIACKGCGAIVLRNPSSIAPSGNVFCTKCGKNRGELHPRWTEGQYINRDGYRMVLKDGCYQREHRVIWEEVNQACLLSGATIHHVDFDKLNNDPDNLLLLTGEDHGRLHRFLQYGRLKEAEALLRVAGASQLHYPAGIDSFISHLVLSDSLL